MDLGIMYFIFPRLSESRTTLQRSFVLADEVVVIAAKKPMPIRRRRQQLRLLCHHYTEKRPLSPEAKTFRVIGITEIGERIEGVLGTSGGDSICFEFPQGNPPVSFEIASTSTHPWHLKAVWVCSYPIK